MVSPARSSNSFIFFFSCLFLFLFVSIAQAKLLGLDVLSASEDDPYTCSAESPCDNGACCGASGNCGYGPKYCGTGCQSNCNATASCGEYAETPGQGCPLNVCCSEYGFCGTTSEFCGKGCQSHCTQPKPLSVKSNVQQRIIGYWEAWNMEHRCGTMGPGEIPVQMLTHLVISFGYISHDFKITNMNGVSADMYKMVGDLKQRNPNLKIMIALGGWAFSDPGTWQSIFPTMVSSHDSRQTFIKNLLGFLSEYGYDGVDFDWEYPGADDRGGSASDGASYTQLLRELRAAITASGRDYLVTFTSPTSYWYLRHFDLKAMTDYADWVNLMAYDIHGVWDSSNPVGNHVLAHTNLTDIDLALDLFWRVDVDPSSIVLGLGFYGRTFKLSNPSCWKPGCQFSGAGAKGSCTNTEGILSYHEIKHIRDNTGGTAYLDKEAAVRYMVYNSNSWVSFDDETTFKMKIDYANKMGLAGLMVWAIDLDDNYLNALRAISDPDSLDSTDSDFDLVDLKNIFPPESLPPAGTKPVYGLSTFGTGDSMSPNGGGFGFLLIAGDSYAVSRLRRRDSEPEPFHFLDCPSNVSDSPKDKAHTARVVCLSDDIAGCFQVMERGVEGTIVEMPDNCAPNTFARALSLELSEDQALPANITKRNPTSHVYDFKFDYNMGLARRDTNNTSIRLDYSNVKGYWDRIVDSPGEQDKKARDLMKRYYSDSNEEWRKDYGTSNAYFQYENTNAVKIKEDLSGLAWWQSIDDCEVEGSYYNEGFAAYVSGSIDAEMYFGFSLVAQFYNGELSVEEANGFVKAAGMSDLTYGISGFGEVDVARENKGNPMHGAKRTFDLKGTTISAGANSFVTFNPYLEMTYQMASFNDSTGEDFSDSAANFDGSLSTRVIQDFSNVTAFWPINEPDDQKPSSGSLQPNEIHVGKGNQLFYSSGNGGKLAVGTFLNFGLNIGLDVQGKGHHRTLESANVGTMGLMYNTFAEFAFYPGGNGSDDSCSDFNVGTVVHQEAGADGPKIPGWDSNSTQLGNDNQTPSQGAVCYPNYKSQKDTKRDNAPRSFDDSSIADESLHDNNLTARGDSDYVAFPGNFPNYVAAHSPSPNEVLSNAAYDALGEPSNGKLGCKNCASCVETKDGVKEACCGCDSMDWTWSFSDIPSYPYCDCCETSPDNYMWPYGKKRLGKGLAKRSFNSPDEKEEDEYREDQDSKEDSEDDTTVHSLYRRRNNKVTISEKRVSVCGESDYALGKGKYPAFPKLHSTPWDGVEGGKWDSISKYWGNSSSRCWDWSVTDLFPADRDIEGNTAHRSDYQTEHVFEGQLIGDFFSNWLNHGSIKNREPAPQSTSTKMSCDDTLKYVLDKDTHWEYDNEETSFFQLMLRELGSIDHLNRLAIFMSRPNGMKGSMFSGNQPVSKSSWRQKNPDQQLQSAKQMGMVFKYLSNPVVWDKFCGTYEAIYTLLGKFDSYHATQNSGLPNLQQEWAEYIGVVLDSMVTRSRATFQYMYHNRAAYYSPFYTFIWVVNSVINTGNIKLDGSCPNLSR